MVVTQVEGRIAGCRQWVGGVVGLSGQRYGGVLNIARADTDEYRRASCMLYSRLHLCWDDCRVP